MYIVDHNTQFIIFIASLGLGFLLGILYDILRTVKLSLTQKKQWNIVFDLIYFFIVGLITFLFILAANKGEVRSYILIGELLGAVVYYFAFGIIIVKFTDKLVTLFKRFFLFLFKVISSPFKLIFKIFKRIFGKFKKFFQKTSKKHKKIQKNLLQKLRIYVYNLLCMLKAKEKS
ncbi:MAG: spore cortex biosynthesis protein YabQ [Acutalibacteraceae bacterium]